MMKERYILEIETDPITKQPPTYTIGNQRGCKVELTLSDGSVVNGYCK